MQPNTGLLIGIATLVGFVGDIGVQLAVENDWLGKNGAGLKVYFAQHGRSESLFIASGLMAFFYTLYAMTGLPFKLQYIAVYAVLLDFMFRYGKVFNSLDGFYRENSIPITTTMGAIIPFILPLLILKLVKRDAVII
jgi:hypothetical protein